MTPISASGAHAVVAGMCSVSFLYFGMYILGPTFKEKRLWPLFCFCIFSSLWSFSYVMYYLSADAAMKDIWQRLIFAGMCAFAVMLWFLIEYTELSGNRRTEAILCIALSLPSLLIAYKSLSENAVAKAFPFGFWFVISEIQTTIYNLASIACLLLFYVHKKTNKRKRQLLILAVTGLACMSLSWVADYYFGFRGTQNIMPFWLLLWVGILLFTIKRYRFIRVTPEFIGKDVTDNIEEGIILLDPEAKVVFINPALRRLLNVKNGGPDSVYDLFFERCILENELSELSVGGGTAFRVRINLLKSETGEKLPVELRVRKIIDAYQDQSGFLMIVAQEKDMKCLRTLYNISMREADVVRQLTAGRSNRDIAAILGIKESTVESHITSIYNKLGVNNRIELMNLLSEVTRENDEERRLLRSQDEGRSGSRVHHGRSIPV